VFFSDEITGFTVGTGGTILKTSDGGNNWISQMSGTSENLTSVFFTDNYNGYIVGYSGTILKTGDGGNTWIPQLSSTNNNLRAIYFTNQNTGFIVGDYGTILKTINGGGIIPVELSLFTATFKNKSVYLNWVTSSELNSRGFEIERSTNKKDFRLVGFKEGNGTTTEEHSYSFVDDLFGVNSYKLYYRLKQIDFNGSFEYSDIVEVEMTPTEFSLSQNYPNPFNPTTSIEYRIGSTEYVTLKVYDVLGREAATLVNEVKQPGVYEVEFNPESSIGNLPAGRQGLASGVYYCQLKGGNFVETKKMILIK